MSYHVPVLLEESLQALQVREQGTYVDVTLGGGGHMQQVLNRLGPHGTAVGMDRDPEAIACASRTLSRGRGRFFAVQSSFSRISGVLEELGLQKVDGILADLGVSSHQIDDPARGFSYSCPDAPLDMRMGPDAPGSAAELLAHTTEEALSHVLREYGEIRNPSRMARTLLAQGSPPNDSASLRCCLEREYGSNLTPKMLSKLYQSLRIAVNGELDELAALLEAAAGVLRTGGRLVVIAYHSLEDRMVKRALRDGEGHCTCHPRSPVCSCGTRAVFKRITRKPVTASPAEVAANPRARSARMRAAEKVG